MGGCWIDIDGKVLAMRLKPGRRISGLYIFQAEEAVKAKYVVSSDNHHPTLWIFFHLILQLVPGNMANNSSQGFFFFDPPQKNQRLG